MDPARVQRNLRDLVNTPGEIMALPGRKLGDLATVAAGERAKEEAIAEAEESKIGLKELTLQKQGEEWTRGMETAKKGANRALIYAGLGTALKLGSAHLVQKKVDEIVAKMVGREKAYDEMRTWTDSLLAEFLTQTGIRKQIQQEAFGGQGYAGEGKASGE